MKKTKSKDELPMYLHGFKVPFWVKYINTRPDPRPIHEQEHVKPGKVSRVKHD